jgi:hypothetical protein
MINIKIQKLHKKLNFINLIISFIKHDGTNTISKFKFQIFKYKWLKNDTCDKDIYIDSIEDEFFNFLKK